MFAFQWFVVVGTFKTFLSSSPPLKVGKLCPSSELHVDVDVFGDFHDFRDFYGKSRRLLKIGYGKDLHARVSNQHLGLVHARSLDRRGYWGVGNVLKTMTFSGYFLR